MISGIECGFEPLRVLGIAGYLVKINDRIEMPRRANPCVDGFSIGFRCRTRMVITRSDERQNRRTKDLNAVRVRTSNHLLVGGSDVMNQSIVLCSRNFAFARQRSDVVDAFENDKVASAGLGEHVMIEARQSVWSEAVEQNAVAADSMIQNRNLSRRGACLQTFGEHIGPAIVCVRVPP